MNIAVCDDETEIRNRIREMIGRRKADCQVELYETGEELLSSGISFDMIFLDIQLEGKNGIEIARMLRQKGKESILIFITGLKEYVFDAFDVGAFHYLLKPVDEKKFSEVFDRAITETEGKKKQETFLIKTRSRSVAVRKCQILYVESRMRKVEIHACRETYEIYGTMNGLEKELGEGFYRCHRGYLVNLAHVSEYTSDSIRLSDGTRIYLSREKYNEFVKVYMDYLESGGISYA